MLFFLPFWTLKAQDRPANIFELWNDSAFVEEFRALKRCSRGSLAKREEHFFRPDGPGYYYGYFSFCKKPPGVTGSDYFGGLRITVFRSKDHDQGAEVLILLKSRVKDPDLGALDLVGRSFASFVEKNSYKYLKINSLIIFQERENILAIHLDNGMISWFKFVKVNLEITGDQPLPELLQKF